MNPKIPVTQRDGLRELSKAIGKPITELVEMAITRVLTGDTTLPKRSAVERVAVSVYLPYEKEQALKELSKETNVSIEEIYRVAIQDLLKGAQSLIDKAHELAAVQEAQISRKGNLLSRDEALMARREALMAQQEAGTEVRADTQDQRGVVQDVRGVGRDQRGEDQDIPGPRPYTRGRRNHH